MAAEEKAFTTGYDQSTYNGVPIAAGDIVAVRGAGFFARGILKATGNTVSHVGLLTSTDPPLVVEALARVKTRELATTIAKAERAFILHDKSLTAWARRQIVGAAVVFSAEGYNWGDIALQGMDAIGRTTWFTDHLSIGLARDPICSYVVAAAYRAVNLSFGKVKDQSVRPSTIYYFARSHPEIYSIGQVK